MMSTLRLEPRGSTLVVRFHNPPTDLVNGQMLTDLDVLTRRLARDRETRAVVLTGPRDGVFLPHFDLAEILAGSEQLGMSTPYPLGRGAIEAVAALLRLPGAGTALHRTPLSGLVTLLATHRTLDRFARLPQVVIAAIGGDALGGGCEVALACDLRLMADGPYLIGLPELSAGIPPGAGGSVRLTRIVGASRATAMMLQARPWTALEAEQAGLVDRVVTEADLLPSAIAVADQVGVRNPQAVASVKRVVRAAGGPTSRAMRTEAAGFVAAASGSAARDRLSEFAAASTTPSTPWRDRSWLG
jgi:enoyl-CoA hydratase